MPLDMKTLQAERSSALSEARALTDKAEKEKRSLTAEENQQFDKLMDTAEARKADMDRELRLREQERSADLAREREDRASHGAGDAPDAMLGFRSWLTRGDTSDAHGQEFRALSAGVNTEGGYLVAPEMFVTDLIKAIDDEVFIRSLATTYQVERAASMGAPELKADPADADWTTELQTGSEDGAMSFGKRSIYPHPLAKRIKVSQNLLRQSALNAEQIVMERMAYKFGITEEKAFMTGNGSGQPLGVFTASADGISTGRDISTGNTSSAIAIDGLQNAKYALKAQYQASAVWVFHRDGVKGIALIKDSDGRPIWQPSLQAGQPDLLLGRPVYMSEYAPNTFSTGQYVGMFGDFSHYWIVDALNMQMQRLTELYAEANQIGFIARKETDGAPVLEEAFARVKLA